jgi:metallo-beta-lactamase class B
MGLPCRIVAILTGSLLGFPVSNAQVDDSLFLMPEELFRRNIGTPTQMNTRHPPFNLVDNIHYVGTESLASYLIVTSEGHILVNAGYERTVPLIKQSVEELGFDFEDIAIIVGSHEHADHMEGDILAKQLSGAEVVVMAQQVPGLIAMHGDNRRHPIDRVIADGDRVRLGNTVMLAHLTPGHTEGCTSWELEVEEAGQRVKVVINCSIGVNPNFILWNNQDRPDIVEQYRYSHQKLRTLAADIPLGSHPAMFNMAEKYQLLGNTPTNPFIDPEGYMLEITINEKAMEFHLQQQRRAAERGND